MYRKYKFNLIGGSIAVLIALFFAGLMSIAEPQVVGAVKGQNNRSTFILRKNSVDLAVNFATHRQRFIRFLIAGDITHRARIFSRSIKMSLLHVNPGG